MDLRNQIEKQGTPPEKQGTPPVSTSAFIEYLDMGKVMRDLPPPPGAKAFFFGDNLGGAGWEVELPDGSIEKYYVQLPGHARHSFGFHVEGTPDDEDAATLLRYVLDQLASLVDEADRLFAKQAE